MKIDIYEVPVTLKRNSSGEVEIELNENEKKFLRSEPLEATEASRIPNIAKELADSNDKQRILIKGTMLPREMESKGTIILKYLS